MGGQDQTFPPTPSTIAYITCKLESINGDNGVNGIALIQTIPETRNARLQADLKHPNTIQGEKSFHFHSYGGTGELDGWKKVCGVEETCPVFKSTVDLQSIKIEAETTKTSFDETYTLPEGVDGIYT